MVNFIYKLGFFGFFFHIQLTIANNGKINNHVHPIPHPLPPPVSLFRSFTAHAEITRLFRGAGKVEAGAEAADWFSLSFVFLFFWFCALQSKARSVQRMHMHARTHTRVREKPHDGFGKRPTPAAPACLLFYDMWHGRLDKCQMRQLRLAQECSNYLCICSLAWWRPTAAVKECADGEGGEGGETIRTETAKRL